jgi:predicted dehydrogenase
MSIEIVMETKYEDMREIKVGIIGCGGIANGKHMPSLKRLPNVKMVAFCDIIPERAEAARRDFGTPDAVAYTDYRDLLKISDIEVVHVLTPNKSHAEISIAALEAGKHVMCEKPMAASSAEAHAMVEAARRTGKKLTVGYQTRSTTAYQFARKFISSGKIGEVYYAKAPAIRRRGVPLWGVFLDKELQGGGPMIDIGTHSIDACLFLMNNYDVSSVTGVTYRRLPEIARYSNAWGIIDPEQFEVEDAAMGFVKFKNGASLYVEASWLLNMESGGHLTLCGTLGGIEMRGETVRVNGEHDGALFTQDIRPTGTSRVLFKGENLTPEQYEAKQWIYSVINDLPPLVKPEEACVVSDIIEAIYKSAETGKTIYFD